MQPASLDRSQQPLAYTASSNCWATPEHFQAVVRFSRLKSRLVLPEAQGQKAIKAAQWDLMSGWIPVEIKLSIDNRMSLSQETHVIVSMSAWSIGPSTGYTCALPEPLGALTHVLSSCFRWWSLLIPDFAQGRHSLAC